jgi:cell division protein FtsB
MRFAPSPLSAKRPFLSGKSRPPQCNPALFALSMAEQTRVERSTHAICPFSCASSSIFTQGQPLSESEDMRRLLPIGFAAFTLASLAIFFFGDSGLAAYQGVLRYDRSLAANVEALKQRNQDLAVRLQRLKTDRESNVMLARDIGMYEPGVAVVKLTGRPPRSEIYAMGDLLMRRKADAGRNAAYKEAALSAAVVLLLAVFLATRIGRRKADGARRR